MFRPADVFSTGIVPIRQMSCFPPARPLETGGCAPSPSCLAADRLPGRGKALWTLSSESRSGWGLASNCKWDRRVGTRSPRRLVARLSAARIHGPPAGTRRAAGGGCAFRVGPHFSRPSARRELLRHRARCAQRSLPVPCTLQRCPILGGSDGLQEGVSKPTKGPWTGRG